MSDVGRPTVMTPEVIAKLEIAFANGATDEQACFVANISKNSLYDYILKYPEFGNRKENLKDDIKYQAKVKIREAILKEDKTETAKWYLERKDKSFKPKSDITTDDEPLPILIKFINGIDGKDDTDNIDTTGVSTPIQE